MKVYISGKITGIEKEAFGIFKDAEEFLIQLGFIPINPLTLPHLHDKSYNSYMKEDVKALCDCCRIYMLKNYKDSPGALKELEIAKMLGIEIIYE